MAIIKSYIVTRAASFQHQYSQKAIGLSADLDSIITTDNSVQARGKCDCFNLRIYSFKSCHLKSRRVKLIEGNRSQCFLTEAVICIFIKSIKMEGLNPSIFNLLLLSVP